ncbi:tail fiber domain-containing protein [Winogradskyella ouciana]|uniref:Peptidase S74 domain-containing protein n=1 Tax=Winogradskyella ouciana TaxID=2608631 RepID=A0A7K1G9T8_9FLAO|nr:tail fiber domain-containing protein [Winogradskyella ouciana]MTE26067.1 hypothetical protein [Winogradskyella ouciana]
MRTKLITLIFLVLGIMAYAQQAINYKAIVKDDLGNVLANQTITIEFSILEGPVIEFTTVVYAETHAVNTDANGILMVNIGEGVPLSGYEDGYDQLDWRTTSFFGSRFLKVQIDSGSGLIDIGTTEFKAVPYALYAEQSNNTGLEAIDEGNGRGWRLIDRPEDFYGPIADGAVDLSNSLASSTTRGATGNYATAVGLNTTASGQGSFASGVGTIASQSQATAMGAGSVASGHTSVALGHSTRAEAPNSMAVGIYNIGGGDPLLAASTDPLFEIGNGHYVDGINDVRSNALTVLRNGTITAPSFDISEITDNKSLITKEYADANYSGGGSSANPTGLEAIDEGNGIGWRLVGVDENNYGNIGNEAIDLSINNIASAVDGAVGNRSVALGFSTEASGAYALATGYNTEASGETSTAMGLETEAVGDNSTALGKGTSAIGENSLVSGELSFATGKNTIAMGNGLSASALYSTALGGFNIGGGDPLNWVGADPVFEIGNGTGFGDKSNAFTVLKNGTITAPSFEMAEITDPKALITKEFADANYSGSGSGTNPTGLEALNEGNGNGWRFIGTNPNHYGSIGSYSVDLSFSGLNSEEYGSKGDFSIATGAYTEASGIYSSAFGHNTKAQSRFSTAFGLNNIGGGDPQNWINSDPLFEIGNGNTTPSNALTILKNGTITAPSFDIAEITDPKALITKEYLEANSSIATGLEAIDEGNGIGWRLIGSDPNNYGNIGENAVDLSYSFYASDTSGALGTNSFSVGYDPSAIGHNSIAMGTQANASGFNSMAFGFSSDAIGENSVAMGPFANASASNSMAIGYGTIADDYNSTVIGNWNDATISSQTLFQVGNGTGSAGRSNALTVLKNGTITAPSLDIAEITDAKALITKEYLEANVGNATGLEAIDEGNGIGWRLKYRVPSAYGNIGYGAIDLSYAVGSSNNYGALGFLSTAFGIETIASGSYSTVMGGNTVADESYLTVVGRYNDHTASTTELFQIGNGTSQSSRSNAFTVLQNGFTSVGTHNEEPTSDFQVYHDNGGTENGFKLQNKGANENWWRFYTLNSNGQLYLYSKAGGNTNAVGSFNSASGAYSALSDRRVKDNFNDLHFNWQDFMQLKPLTYHYKTDNNKQTHIGLIAQDVKPIYPELVNYNKENDLYQLNYSGFGVVAIKAIQEQQIIIENQQKQIDELKALLENQKQSNENQAMAVQTLLNRVEALENNKSPIIIELVKN